MTSAYSVLSFRILAFCCLFSFNSLASFCVSAFGVILASFLGVLTTIPLLLLEVAVSGEATKSPIANRLKIIFFIFCMFIFDEFY
ncbi:hypothetical protein HMPREF9296_1415 [Prevotella disiens FB035-09AN]|uniref:Uncharacterized protein n=1 Tax=Prevotella disiens FB035-09AN TaxID=866771 RepID=E1KRV6_9BACT|nr:hypothetical protein HMPREF9296_1415 [Prevotella disiens FB035-09AN]